MASLADADRLRRPQRRRPVRCHVEETLTGAGFAPHRPGRLGAGERTGSTVAPSALGGAVVTVQWSYRETGDAATALATAGDLYDGYSRALSAAGLDAANASAGLIVSR